MEPRVSLITLAVADLSRAREFYVDGLGWPVHFEDGDGVVMIRVGAQQLLSLWSLAEFEQEVGSVRTGDGVVPVTLAHNVATDAEVDAVLAEAGAAGADVESAQRRVWGGYSGYFSDPDGFRWEIANAGEQLVFLVP